MLKDSLFWKFNTPEAKHDSYIFGTIHLYRDSYADFITKAEEIIDNVDKVYTEASLESSPGSAHYLIPNNEDLISLLGLKKYEKVKKILDKAIGFNLDQYKNILPLAINQHITMMAMGLSHRPALDTLIYQSAIRAYKEYDGIESLDEQMEIMQNISLEYQLKSLVKLSQNINKFRKKVKRMLDLYEDEKIALLYKSSKKEMGELRKLLLFDRNEVIGDRIYNMHFEKRSLFTFGAGHLAGNKGVLAILKRKGAKLAALM